MPDGGNFRVKGLEDLHRALHDLGPAVQEDADKASRDVAGFVATDARSAALSIGGVAAHVAPSIEATESDGQAGVSIGGSSWPMAEGAASGSHQYAQFKPYVGDGGYFPYPQAEADAERIERRYADELEHTIKRRFPE